MQVVLEEIMQIQGGPRN